MCTYIDTLKILFNNSQQRFHTVDYIKYQPIYQNIIINLSYNYKIQKIKGVKKQYLHFVLHIGCVNTKNTIIN
ncbi:hypothetical protein EAF28_11150 [Staphylococcus pseudintermedius]|nr:hypothetical protein [Staphylococcus pseudintermedius]EGQ4383194.1 hypothetical protein [Staphylococcus pseudintermedius]RYS09735.1 hypothetical protein DLS51_01075 [Staphylococcus pseudintermedius]